MDTFFLARGGVPSKLLGMSLWRERVRMDVPERRQAFGLLPHPANRVVELGTKVEI
jgi:KUP system potassium uptake protein